MVSSHNRLVFLVQNQRHQILFQTKEAACLEIQLHNQLADFSETPISSLSLVAAVFSLKLSNNLPLAVCLVNRVNQLKVEDFLEIVKQLPLSLETKIKLLLGADCLVLSLLQVLVLSLLRLLDYSVPKIRNQPLEEVLDFLTSSLRAICSVHNNSNRTLPHHHPMLIFML